MKRSTLLSLITLFAMLGIADAAYLAQTALTNGTLLCNIDIIDGCNTVAKSPYAHLFGIPLGIYGVGFFGVYFLAALWNHYRPHRQIDLVLVLLGIIGLVASAAFLYIQFVLIQALCIYCLASAVFTVILAVASFLLYFRTRSGLPAVQTTLPSA